ncbi:hypothetical protein QQF64_028039 [Cirrhinus molitorella]|uniref:Ig-like domain-containing protein n=1 Tax=Cirrhinus molitorella TaxID=172907 RepID=A0ABR3N5I8_9TELE
MQLSNCVLMLMPLMIADGLIVYGPSSPLVAPLGSSVVLPCYVVELLLMDDLEVEWRRTDSMTLVHLYQDGKSRPEAQQQDYHDRAHFFTDQIKNGNFSLRLDNLNAEDEGRYTCKVYSQQDSGETVVHINNVEHLLVSGSDESISASVGEDITLNCSVVSYITPQHIEEVSWKKTDEDEDILVLLYQDHEALSDSSDERYRDRVEFFTAEIPKGNFSLILKSVRTEDKGVYKCQVFAGGLSANATVVLNVGFSTLHIIILIFCISASGSALLFFCLIYCTSHNNGMCIASIIKVEGIFFFGRVRRDPPLILSTITIHYHSWNFESTISARGSVCPPPMPSAWTIYQLGFHPCSLAPISSTKDCHPPLLTGSTSSHCSTCVIVHLTITTDFQAFQPSTLWLHWAPSPLRLHRGTCSLLACFGPLAPSILLHHLSPNSNSVSMSDFSWYLRTSCVTSWVGLKFQPWLLPISSHLTYGLYLEFFMKNLLLWTPV